MTSKADIIAYKDALIVLGIAGVVVPLVLRFKLSPILGFLLAGALLGPAGLGSLAAAWPGLAWITVTHQESVSKLAEFGVVFLLFLIGLELSLPRLFTMRRLVFGLGTLQVMLSAGAIAGALGLLQMPLVPAIVIGLALALSSTAIVIEVLSRQQRVATTAGRTSFAILLLQDLAVVPVLFVVSILATRRDGSVLIGLFQALAQGAFVVAGIVLTGRLVLRPLFRSVASAHSQDLFIAATLFVAVAGSLAGAAVGLSMALGAFIAGLLLAETEYRRAIEAVTEPFKGLLLGIFFFSVGMSLDLRLLFSSPFALLIAVAALIAGKALIVFGLARLFAVPRAPAVETGLLLGPSGEFAFVVIGLAAGYGIIERNLSAFTLAVASLSMALIPVMSAIARSMVRRLVSAQAIDPELQAQPSGDARLRAIVIGYGRVGQLVSAMLDRHGVTHLASDRDPIVVGKWRRQLKPVYYGDARQAAFLERCGLATAAAVVITIHTHDEIDEIVRVVRSRRPDIVIVARARDAIHARHLYELGVTDAVPETIEASLQLSEAALVGVGVAAGPVIASIHDQRDIFRRELQSAAGAGPARTPGGMRRQSRGEASE